MIRRFTKPVTRETSEKSTSINEVLNFEDFSNLKSVAWVGEGGNSFDVEIRTHDGKDVLIDSVPAEYLKLGGNREEVYINAVLANNSIRVVSTYESNVKIKGCLVFTCEK